MCMVRMWGIFGLLVVLVLSTVFEVSAQISELYKRYEAFLNAHGANLTRLLDVHRLSIFNNTIYFLEKRTKDGVEHPSQVGLTMFADWTQDELDALFQAGKSGYNKYQKYVSSAGFNGEAFSSTDAALSGSTSAGTLLSSSAGGDSNGESGSNTLAAGPRQGMRSDSIRATQWGTTSTGVVLEQGSSLTVAATASSLNWGSSMNPTGSSILPPVRNQGLCGACWAFTAVANTEASVRIATGRQAVHLSTQELLDCDRFYDRGCDGGNPMFAMAYITINGLSSAADYPYTELQTPPQPEDGMPPSAASSSSSASKPAVVCQRRERLLAARASIDYFRVLPTRRESAIKAALLDGPVSVGVCGHDLSFLFYSGGIYDEPSCCEVQNHAMLLVGYDTDSQTGKDYFIAQNSWGKLWGEKGFMRLAMRGDGDIGQCAIALNPSQTMGGRLFQGGVALRGSVSNDDDDEGFDQPIGWWDRWVDEVLVYMMFNATPIIACLSVLLLGVLLYECVVALQRAPLRTDNDDDETHELLPRHDSYGAVE